MIKRVAYGALVVAAFVAGLAMPRPYIAALDGEQVSTKTCPAGSYEIGRKEPGGDPICKLEPTGCPYGDSIPLDMCDKFAPPKEVQPTTTEPATVPVEQPKPAKECGK